MRCSHLFPLGVVLLFGWSALLPAQDLPPAGPGVTPELGQLYPVEDGADALADVTGLLSRPAEGWPAFFAAGQPFDQVTLKIRAEGPPEPMGIARNAPWRGLRFPQNVDRARANLDEILVVLRYDEQKGGRLRAGQVPTFHKLETLSQLRSWLEKTTTDAPVKLDIKGNVPVVLAVGAMAVLIEAKLPFVLVRGPSLDDDRRQAGVDAQAVLAAALAEVATESVDLPKVGVRLRAGARVRWQQVAEVLAACVHHRVERFTLVANAGEVEVDLATSVDTPVRLVGPPEPDPRLRRNPRPETVPPPVDERPIKKLEVEPLGDEPKGTDFNNRNRELDSAEMEDAFGIGGGRARSAYPFRKAKRAALSFHGGTDGTEDAVHFALLWLRRHQSVLGPEDRLGFWDADGFSTHCAATPGDKCGTVAKAPPVRQAPGPGNGMAEYDVGVTALSLLAFLGAGYTQTGGEFADTIQRGLGWLLAQQQDDGSIGFNRAVGETIYNHALATTALAEAYAMTRDFRLRHPLRKAVAFIVQAQNPGAGWRYGTRPGESDTSVTAVMFLALKAAALTSEVTKEGPDTPPLVEIPAAAFNDALKYLDAVSYKGGDPEGGELGPTGYQFAGDPGSVIDNTHVVGYRTFPTMTAVALVCRLFAKQDPNSQPIQYGVDLLMGSPPHWGDRDGKSEINLYYWYSGAQAMFQVGRPRWTCGAEDYEHCRRKASPTRVSCWNHAMQEALLPNQRQAYFVDDAGMTQPADVDGSWDPIGDWGVAGGRVYATAIGALTLEVYYRYDRMGGR